MFKAGITEWNKLGNNIYQKIFIGKNGLPRFTYHYGSKKGKECEVIELDTDKARNLAGYQLIEKDLRDILSFIDEYSKIVKNKNFDETKTLMKAIVKAIIVTYWKCFASTKKGEEKGRQAKLKDKNIPEESKDIHNMLKDMRNKYISHAGKSEHEECKLIIVLPPIEKLNKLNHAEAMMAPELLQTIAFQGIRTDIKKLIENLHAQVNKKISELSKAFGKSFMDIGSLYKHTKKGKKRTVLR